MRSRPKNNRTPNWIDPIFFILIIIGDEEHSGLRRWEFKGGGFVKNIFSAFDSEARGYGDDAAGDGGVCGGGRLIFEPEEFALFENEPTAAPGFDVVALFC